MIAGGALTEEAVDLINEDDGRLKFMGKREDGID
jgi:hypothetical protein